MENTTVSEETLDRLIAKAERLKSLLMECDDFISDIEGAPVSELKEAGPQIVYTINLGEIQKILSMPSQMFTPGFNAKLSEDLPQILAARPKEPEPDRTKSGDYKKPSIKTPLIIPPDNIGKA
jgi:hypothetical protein